jgi:hypothetical protein
MVAVAWKHPKVHLEFGAIAPRYPASLQTGWQPVSQFMNSLLQDRILFGSSWLMSSRERLTAEIPLLQLTESMPEKYLETNAETLLDCVLG